MRIVLTDSMIAALQLVQACLPLTPWPGWVMEAELQGDDEANEGPDARTYSLRLRVRCLNDMTVLVWANCSIRLTQAGWTEGYCRLSDGRSGMAWEFQYDISRPEQLPWSPVSL